MPIPNGYIGKELEVLVFPVKEVSTYATENLVQGEKDCSLSKSMQKAMDDEKNGHITKLVNHKNAVAEILG
jgi:hypothetical protein